MYAVIPAAGHSRRMGQPKLLMRWSQERTMIEHVLSIWSASQIQKIVLVVRPDDERLAEICRRTEVDLVVPALAPVDMKQSVQFGLDYISQHFQPSASDAWLLAPADMPALRVSTIDQVMTRYRDRPGLIVPTYQGRRGHPVLFPWRLAEQVSQLGPDEGLNALVKRSECEEVETDDPGCVRDVDSPDDYRQLRP